eukprot:14851078-Alexandrium_andersonii.AAC.1
MGAIKTNTRAGNIRVFETWKIQSNAQWPNACAWTAPRAAVPTTRPPEVSDLWVGLVDPRVGAVASAVPANGLGFHKAE